MSRVAAELGPDLAAQLAAVLRSGGDQQVDSSSRRRAEYTTDASNYRVVPQAVVFPRDSDDVEAISTVCAEMAIPLTSRGAGTSVAGNAVGSGVVLDFSRHMNRILEVDPVSQTALVQPGVILDDLQRAAGPHGLRFGPDPSTHARCTIGGMIGNDACGSHALAYGRTSDNVLAQQVVDATGRNFHTAAPPAEMTAALRAIATQHLSTIRMEFGTFGRQVSGYALENLLPEFNPGHGGLTGKRVARLLTGSEGTLATTVAATVRLVTLPPATSLVVVGFIDMAAAADATVPLLEHKPLAMEGIDRRLVNVIRARGRTVSGLPHGGGWLFVEIGGHDDQEADSRAKAFLRTAMTSGAMDAAVISDPRQARALWKIREDGAGLAGRSPDGRPAWPGWEDAAVPPAHLGPYLREFQALLDRYHLDGLAYGHFGDGCIHVRIDFPLARPDGMRVTRDFLLEAAALVVRHGGSLSGEHGDGRARSELLALMYSPEAILAFEQIKAAFDPQDQLNPGIIVHPRPLVADLRIPQARPAGLIPANGRAIALTLTRKGPGTQGFTYPADDDFTDAVHRCVGVGKCRADSGGVMCPSYLATRDEKDSTRGRARLLQEMANGNLISDGWHSTEVKESLDLCLSCKGCAVDCPAGVDMATYKSEFINRYYRGRLRPRSHYILGWLPRWSKMAAASPRLVNRALKLPGVARLARATGGIDQRRPLPEFATPTFRSWFQHRGSRPAQPGLPTPVILWVDSFTDHFDPAVGQAAVTVLEHLGFAVSITSRRVCCGLTWVSTGQLDGAKRQLRQSMAALAQATQAARTAHPQFRPEVPIIGLEPSCTALLREDAARLLPQDPEAQGLSRRVFTLAELLNKYRPEWIPPTIGPDATAHPAVVQPHCHQHAVMGFSADQALMAKVGIDPTVLSGCCGLAGNFGAEKGHYDVSVKVAERALLPALHAAQENAGGYPSLIIADGFSCRTQTQNLTGLRPVHLAQVLATALSAAALQPGTRPIP